jgi:phosphohistidine phosphatase SixA
MIAAMEPPAITRYRRPFLAPLWLIPAALLVLAVCGWAIYQGATTTVVLLVQPTDKEPGTIEDPPVSPEGEERAERLARMFAAAAGPGQLDAIYESDERRAQQTVAPLAERLHQTPVVFSAADARSAAAQAVREHPGATVLVVVSGARVAEMVEELTGVTPAALPPGGSDVMYVVSVPRIGHAHLVRIRY